MSASMSEILPLSSKFSGLQVVDCRVKKVPIFKCIPSYNLL